METEPNRTGIDERRRSVLKAVGAGVLLAGFGGGTAAATSRSMAEHGIGTTLTSAISIDAEANTVTLPLYRGRSADGRSVYFVLTESSDLDRATELGVNWAPKLQNALGTPAVQEVQGTSDDGRFEPQNQRTTFAGTVDFGPERRVEPGPEGFPLDTERTQPGSVGDAAYSPFVTTGDGVVYNAPHVANETGVHDSVVGEMDTSAMEVTIELVEGFYEDRLTHYVSLDAYPADVAALEGATFADTLSTAPTAGDRSLDGSAREPIFPVVNGPMGADNPERQGLRSAVAGEGGPLNVVRSEQVCGDPGDPTDCSVHYSPLWDVHPVVWTDEAIEGGRRTRLISHEEIIDRFVAGDLASAAADGPVNTQVGNIRGAVAAVNCPIVLVEAEEEEEEEGMGENGTDEGGMG
ncbi:hypothetical protein ACFQH6_12405 [Halobacteriaceae archaeon GCM10025711]